LDPSLRVYAMPEIADLRPAQPDHPQVAQILRDAEGRRMVGLLGNVTLRKGILAFIKLAALAWTRQLPLFFAVAGDFSLNSCGAEFGIIDAACRAAPKNFRLYPKRLADGPEFNAHVAACDVVFAAYLNFPFQSNLLTKAAAFAKPVIVSQGFIMERRTIEYDLGLAVPQDDAEKALQAATALLEEPPAIRRRYADYLNANSLDELDRFLAKLVALPAQ
jgi:glycosyltransferase involved in cell wall biosynthesis